MRVRVQVQMRQHASFQMSPKTAQTVQKWLRYDLNSQRTLFYSYLSQFSTVLAVFGLVLTGKPATRAGWVDTGVGAGQAELPMGYPRQSLLTSSCNSKSLPLLFLRSVIVERWLYSIQYNTFASSYNFIEPYFAIFKYNSRSKMIFHIINYCFQINYHMNNCNNIPSTSS